MFNIIDLIIVAFFLLLNHDVYVRWYVVMYNKKVRSTILIMNSRIWNMDDSVLHTDIGVNVSMNKKRMK